MRVKIDELWPKTCVTVAFLYAILCVITHATVKIAIIVSAREGIVQGFDASLLSGKGGTIELTKDCTKSLTQ